MSNVLSESELQLKTEALKNHIETFAPDGYNYPLSNYHGSSSIYVRWNLTFGVDCDLSLYLKEDTATIVWSSTGRNVSEALAAVSLYRKVIEYAALAESFMKDCLVKKV